MAASQQPTWTNDVLRQTKLSLCSVSSSPELDFPPQTGESEEGSGKLVPEPPLSASRWAVIQFVQYSTLESASSASGFLWFG